MRNACRPKGRFFCLLKVMAAAVLAVAMQAQTNGPAMTQVTDTLYRADGAAAKGSVLISWPAFTTADGKAVAAGSVSVQLGNSGAFTASLAPNTGAQPAGVFYKVVYQLAGQEPSTEYWVVPATGSTTIGSVRAKLQPPTIAAQVLTRDVADTNYVHVNGDQTMNGTVTFKSSPTVPAPQNPGDAANKGYVDTVNTNLLATPPAIGSGTPNAGTFATVLNDSSRFLNVNMIAQSLFHSPNVINRTLVTNTATNLGYVDTALSLQTGVVANGYTWNTQCPNGGSIQGYAPQYAFGFQAQSLICDVNASTTASEAVLGLAGNLTARSTATRAVIGVLEMDSLTHMPYSLGWDYLGTTGGSEYFNWGGLFTNVSNGKGGVGVLVKSNFWSGGSPNYGKWTPNTAFQTAAYTEPTSPNGYWYQVTTPNALPTVGITGNTEPSWCKSENCTVADGTITWTGHAKSGEGAWQIGYRAQEWLGAAYDCVNDVSYSTGYCMMLRSPDNSYPLTFGFARGNPAFAGNTKWVMGMSAAPYTDWFSFYSAGDSLNRITMKPGAETRVSSAAAQPITLNMDVNSGTGGVQFGSGGVSPTAVASIDSSGNATVHNLTVNGTCTGCGGGGGNLSSPGPIGSSTPNTGAFTTLAAQMDGKRYKVEGFPSSCTVNSVPYTTQFDCAFQTAYYAAQTQGVNQTLELGNAVYLTNVGMQQSGFYVVNIIGAGDSDATEAINGQNSIIRMNSTIATPVLTLGIIHLPATHRRSVVLRDFLIDANGKAPSCLDINSTRKSYYEHIACEGATGTNWWVNFGTVIDNKYGDVSGSNYDVYLNAINVISPFSLDQATATVNVVGGTISTTGYTITHAGTSYVNGPTVTAYLVGYGAGTKPCTTMPTGLHATISGRSVTSISSTTGASGCSGNVYVNIPDLPVAAYGFHNGFTTDSTFNDVVVEAVGNVAGIYDFGASGNVWVHPHTWQWQPVALETHGGGKFYGLQCDTPSQYCVDFESIPFGTEGTTMQGTLSFAEPPGGSMYYFGSGVTEVEIRDDYYPGTLAADWHRYVSYNYGPVTGSVANFPNYLPTYLKATGFVSVNAPANEKFDYNGISDQYFGGPIKGYLTVNGNTQILGPMGIGNGVALQGYTDNLVTRTWAIDSLNGLGYATGWRAQDPFVSHGYAYINKGDATTTGGLFYNNPDGSPLAHLGGDAATANSLSLALQSGKAFSVNGGPFQIGGTTVLDTSRNATVNNLTVNGTCNGCGASSSGYGYMVSKYASIQAAINAAYGSGVVSGKVIDDRTAAYNGAGFYIPDSVTVELAPVPYTFTGTVTHNNGNNNVTAAIVVEQGAHLKGSSTSSNHGTTIGVSAGFAGDIIATTSEGTGIGTAAQWWHWGSIENLNISGASQTSGRCLVVENMGETSRVENILARSCYGNNIEIIGASATQSSIRNITTGRSQTASGIRFTNLAGVGKVDGLSGDCNPAALVSVQENAAGSLTILGLKAEGEASICTGTVHDPVILLDGMSGFNDHVRVIGGYAFGTAQYSFAKFINAGNAILETDGLYITGYTNMLNDTVRSVTVPLSSSTSKQPFYYEPGGTTFANQAFTFAPGTFIQGGSSALTEIFGSSTDGSSMIAAQGNGDGTSYYTGGLKIGIPNRTQFGQPPEMMARMGSRFLGAGNGYDTNTWVFVPIWKSGDTSNRWIGEPNQRWPEVYAADVNATTATIGTLNVTNCVGCGSSATWGGISGSLTSQADLQSALSSKQNSLGYTPLNPANNLLDVANVATAKSNLGVPAASATLPAMDGTGAVGSSANYARADHIHPTDTSRVATSTTVNGHALSGNVTVTASDVGAPHSISIQGPTAAVTGTASMTALYSVTIPAGTFSVGTGLRCAARLRHTTGTASVSMAWKLGNTTYTYPTAYTSASLGGDASIEIFTFSSLTAETVNIPWASFGGVTQSPYTGLAWNENLSGATTLQFQFNVAATDKLTGDTLYCTTIQ